MARLQKQKDTLVNYFYAGCKAAGGPLTLGMEVEHFVTHLDGAPVTFEEIQAVMRAMQQPDEPDVIIDGAYMGYTTAEYGVSLEPGCQIEISIAPRAGVAEIMRIYMGFYTKLCNTLAERGMRAYTVGSHPTRRADVLPLIPKKRYEAMDRYFRKSGQQGIHMMRATASTQISVDYYSESDFVQKYRVACLITPLLALLTDNSPYFEGAVNHTYSIRTQIWNDVDPDRCGIPPMVMDDGFGFDAYADYILQKPLVVVRHGPRTEGVGRKTALEVYPAALREDEIEQILSMFFFDARLKNYIELRMADSMPPRYIAAYAVLIKAIFSSPAAQEGILRHYAGVKVPEIEAAKMGVCFNGYKAKVYGRPAAEEIPWLLAQAKSRLCTPEERHTLEPLAELAAKRKTIREVEHYE